MSEYPTTMGRNWIERRLCWQWAESSGHSCTPLHRCTSHPTSSKKGRYLDSSEAPIVKRVDRRMVWRSRSPGAKMEMKKKVRIKAFEEVIEKRRGKGAKV